MTNTRKCTLEEALKAKEPNYAEKYSGTSETVLKAVKNANKKYRGFYKVGKRYTNGVDTIEVKAVEERPEVIHFSVIDGETEILNYSWLDEITGEEHPGEPFDKSYFVLSELGFTQEV